MKFLVTGGTGYIASACIKKLLELGHEVRATTRSLERSSVISKNWELDLAGLSWHKLDLMQAKGWQEAVAGCDIVIHMASPVPKSLNMDFTDTVMPAVSGVRHLMQAVAGSSVKKVVMTSSIAAMRNGQPNKFEFDHNSWTDISGEVSAYAFSKTYAEMTAWNLSQLTANMPDLVTILPGFVVGAPVASVMSSASLASLARVIRSKFILPCCFHMVALKDVVDIHINAALNPDVKSVRLPCCDLNSTSLIQVYQWLRQAGIVQKKYVFDPPGFMLPSKYRVYLDDKVKLKTHITQQLLNYEPSSIEQAVIEMAKFIKNAN